MKILVATGLFPPEIGGPATYSKLLADELPKLGIDVEVLPFREVRSLPKIVRHIAYFFKAMKKGKSADIIFAQDPVSVGLPALCAAKILRKKFAVRVAGDYAWEQARQRFGVSDSIDDFQDIKYSWKVELLRNVQRYVVRRADQVITPSGYFNRIVSGWGAKKVATIYNGISFPSLSKSIPYARKDKILLSAGRLVPWKGFSCIIRLLTDLPEWKLVIAGDGPEKESLGKLATKLNLTDRVRFLGSIPREAMFEWLRKARIFILNTSFESFSYQVVEAMYVGTPVITTNIGSLPEIVEHEQTGILVEPDNAEAICIAIDSIDGNAQFRDLLVQQAQKRSRSFSIDKTVEQLINILPRI